MIPASSPACVTNADDESTAVTDCCCEDAEPAVAEDDGLLGADDEQAVKSATTAADAAGINNAIFMITQYVPRGEPTPDQAGPWTAASPVKAALTLFC